MGTTGEILVAAAGLFLGTVGATALLGAVKWIGRVSHALAKLTEVAEGLAGITNDVVSMRRELSAHVREADARWVRLVQAQARRSPGVPGPRRPLVVDGETA